MILSQISLRQASMKGLCLNKPAIEDRNYPDNIKGTRGILAQGRTRGSAPIPPSHYRGEVVNIRVIFHILVF